MYIKCLKITVVMGMCGCLLDQKPSLCLNFFSFAQLPSYTQVRFVKGQKSNSKYRSESPFFAYCHVKTDRKWKAQKYINIFNYEKFRNRFKFFTCIFPDYMGHESSIEFWKNSCFENMAAGFLRAVKIHFGKIALKWCILRHEKKCFWLTLCCSFWSN